MSAGNRPGGHGHDADDILRRGLAGLGSEAGLPDNASLRTAVVARARRDRAIQRLATSTAVLLPVAVVVWSIGGLHSKAFVDLANMGSNDGGVVATTASPSVTPVVTSAAASATPTPTATPRPSSIPVVTPSVRVSPSGSASASPSTVPTTPVPVPASTAIAVELSVDDVTPSAAGQLIHFVITWSGSDAPVTSVVLQEGRTSGARVLKAWHEPVICPPAASSAAKDGTHVRSGTVEVPAHGTIALIARVHTQVCGGVDRQGATGLNWNAGSEVPPSSTPIAVPTATPTPQPSDTEAPTATPEPTATVGPTASPDPTASPSATSNGRPLSLADPAHDPGVAPALP